MLVIKSNQLCFFCFYCNLFFFLLDCISLLLYFLSLCGLFHLLNGMNCISFWLFCYSLCHFIILLSILFVCWYFFVFSMFVYDYISLLLSLLLLCGLFHLSKQMDCISFQFSIICFFFHFGMLLSFLFGCALVFFIHQLVLLFVFSLFVYDCVFCCSFFFWVCCCLLHLSIVSSSFCLLLCYILCFIVVFGIL